MEDHNLVDRAAHAGIQKGTQAGSREVDARGNVGDESVGWVDAAQRLNLAREVGLLRLAGDSSLDDLRFREGSSDVRDAEEPGELPDIIQPLLGSWKLDDVYLALLRPVDEGLVGDVKVLADMSG